jgi:GNAT superfamily N-acetyltransferase
VLTRLRSYLRERGGRRTALALLRKLTSRLYLRQQLIVVIKDLDSVVEPARRGDLSFTELTAESLPALAELNRQRNRPDIDRRFERYVTQGFNGFVAFSGAEAVGYYWWVDRDAPTLYPDLRKLGLGIELGEGEVYGSDFYLLEAHRGGGVAAEFLFHVESSLRDRGYTRIWGCVDPASRPARWIYSSRGYRPKWLSDRRRFLTFAHTTHTPRDSWSAQASTASDARR